ncbi:MAG: HAD-IIB family hydrolase [Oceanospirillales bacterium]|nr:HAD-IIB family hydrolase [Oceanospirillales bacterium]
MSVINQASLSAIRYLLTDVDDTLTTDGQLLPETLTAIYHLHEAGVQVIPVTGACAGWCDHMVRAWPVSAVIGESGAFYKIYRSEKRLMHIGWYDDAELRRRQAEVIDVIKRELMPHYQDLRFAQDQVYRVADVALDIGQDREPLPQQQIRELLRLLTQCSVQARASSIHINAWRGDFGKFPMALRLLRNEFNLDDEQILNQVAFVGDSANDESMFAGLKYTFGVANIAQWLTDMRHHPAVLLEQPRGLGFVELADRLLEAR